MMSKLLLMMSLVLFTTFSAQAQKNDTFPICNGKIEVTVNDLAPNTQASALVTDYKIVVSPDAIGNCSSLVITPAVIATGSKDKKLVEVIVVNGPGKKGSDRWLESAIYKVCDPNNVRFYTLKENESLVINTNSQVPYEAWMDNGKFVITTQEATYNPNCIKKLCGTENVCDVPYLNSPLNVAPLWANMPAIAGDGAKEPKRAIKTKLYFPVNGIKSVESYLENADALSLLATLDSPNFNVDNIKIEGWASPEASVAYNQKLSNNRANTMKKIIADKYNFPESVYDVKGNGEYWADVLNYIATSNDPAILASKDKLDKFVADNENTNLDKKEILLKRIDNGKPYKAIFKNVYPRSRFTDCEVSYKVKNYDKEEAMVIFKNDPTQLSADEYVQLLNDGADAAVLAKAVEIYPNDTRINSIAAEKAKIAGNIDAALKFYQKAGNSPEAFNNQGCCWLLKGDPDKAQECFNKAKGLDVAEGNANEVRKVVLNNKFFK